MNDKLFCFQVNRALLEGHMNLSTLSSPMHMSTPTEAATKMHKKRLSKSRSKIQSPGEPNNQNQRSTPRCQKSKPTVSPLAIRNGNASAKKVEKVTRQGM